LRGFTRRDGKDTQHDREANGQTIEHVAVMNAEYETADYETAPL
jgi:hypothetical protein